MWNELKEYLLKEMENPEKYKEWLANYSFLKKMIEIRK